MFIVIGDRPAKQSPLRSRHDGDSEPEQAASLTSRSGEDPFGDDGINRASGTGDGDTESQFGGDATQDDEYEFAYRTI